MKVNFKDISLGYKKNIVLSEINLNLSSKDTYGVIGKNGSGKSTLINSLFDSSLVKEGKISFNCNQVSLPIISYVPQELYFPDFLTVAEYLKLHVKENKLSKLIKLYSLEEYLSKELNLLSGGEKRRITLFAAFFREPDILLFDEPDTHLDPVQICNFSKLFSEIKKSSNVLAIIVSNRVDFLKALCSKFVAVTENDVRLHTSLTSELINECYK